MSPGVFEYNEDGWVFLVYLDKENEYDEWVRQVKAVKHLIDTSQSGYVRGEMTESEYHDELRDWLGHVYAFRDRWGMDRTPHRIISAAFDIQQYLKVPCNEWIVHSISIDETEFLEAQDEWLFEGRFDRPFVRVGENHQDDERQVGQTPENGH